MTDTKKILGDCSDDELVAELARRRAGRGPSQITGMEEALAEHQRRDGQATLQRYLANKQQEQNETNETSKPCPGCGKPARIRARERARSIRSTTGEYTLRRRQHYCEKCEISFYPLDIELGLPEEGEVTSYMEKRLLDFGVEDTFEHGAQRWEMHDGDPISENLLRRVVERVGRRAQEAQGEVLQEALRPTVASPTALLVVQTDGSMLPLRGEAAWKEAKLGVMYRQENHLAGEEGVRGRVTEARYVAVLGGQDAFRETLNDALQAEGAESAQKVAWIGDGAAGNWSLAQELGPQAREVLDWAHAEEHATDCAKIVMGENDPGVSLFRTRITSLLWEGHVKIVLQELESAQFGATVGQREALSDLYRYYKNNASRMDYPTYRTLGLPIGSGTVESGHRHVFQDRMKRAGQHWDFEHGQRMVLLRAAYKTAGPKQFHEAINQAYVQSKTMKRAA